MQADRPVVTTRQEGINLYNALSPRLDSHRRRTVDHYFASLAGQKLKNIGIPQPPRDLTDRLSQVWLGQNPEENARTIMKKYPYSQGVLEEVMKNEDVPVMNPIRWAGEAAGFLNGRPQNLLLENDLGEPVFQRLNNSVKSDASYNKQVNAPAFWDVIHEIQDEGDKRAPEESLDFERGLMYALAYNNAEEIIEEERATVLDAYKERTGNDFLITKTEDGTYRYDSKSGRKAAAEAKTNRCASYAGGVLRAMGMELDDDSLLNVDQLHAQLTGGKYKGIDYKEPHPQVRGVIRIGKEGPLSEGGTLSIDEQYAKLVDTGMVREGDVVFFAHNGKHEKDLSHAGIVTKTAASGIFYSGETASRYNRPLSAYFDDRRTKNDVEPYVEIVIRYHSEDEPVVPDVGDYYYDQYIDSDDPDKQKLRRG